MKKYIYNLASDFLDKETIEEFKTNSEGNVISNIAEASGVKKSKVIINITYKVILQLIRYSLAIYIGYYFLYFGYHLINYYTFVDSLMFIYVTGLFITLTFLLIPFKRLNLILVSLLLAIAIFYFTTIFYNSLVKEGNEALLLRESSGVISGSNSKKIEFGGDTRSAEVFINFLEDGEEEMTDLYTNRILSYRIGSSIDYTNWELKYEFYKDFALPSSLKKRRDLTTYETAFAMVNPTDTSIRFVFDKVGIPSLLDTTKYDSIYSLVYANLSFNPDFDITVVPGKKIDENALILVFNTVHKGKLNIPNSLTTYNCSNDFIKLPTRYQETLSNANAKCSWIDEERSYVIIPNDSYLKVEKAK